MECPLDVADCHRGGFLTSDRARRECFRCRLACNGVGGSALTIDGEEISPTAPVNLAAHDSSMAASGPLVDCSALSSLDGGACPGATGSVCLVEANIAGVPAFLLSERAEANGCLALVWFVDETVVPFIPPLMHSFEDLAIPFVLVEGPVGRDLKQKLGSIADVTQELYGNACHPDPTRCTDAIPCEANSFCQFDMVNGDDGEYIEGHCAACPTTAEGRPNPAGCFFSDDVAFNTILQKDVESCARACDANGGLDFAAGCKFCPKDISPFEFGVEDGAERCHFCPKEDLAPEYKDRLVPLLGENITCWMMAEFFSRIDVPQDSDNCQLAQSLNYICGCEGNGYAGADTTAKQNALVWVPRVMAILSGLGSLLILVDVLRTKARRGKLFQQLMALMAVSDLLGSAAFALTTLPIPSEYYLQGAQGNEASCTAQGFFIQVGTVACYTNVSLAFYYYFVIQKGWSETRLKKIRVWFFVCPILVGLTFAFAGIPYYGNMLLWCNNTASWWPDIPVAIAIVVASVVMGSVCWDVHKKTQASKRWQRGGGGGESLSTKVFWQSFWFLMSFYMTWPPYLALQYSWAAGSQYGNYAFILYAGMVVPLQGVWNFFVYARNRQLKLAREKAAAYMSSLRTMTKWKLTASNDETASMKRRQTSLEDEASGVKGSEKMSPDGEAQLATENQSSAKTASAPNP